MPRFKLTIEYDGRPFVGWQRQENGPGVQQAVEEAVLAFSGEDVPIYAAGRTDAGVHALGQVAHVDLVKDWEEDTVRDALNYHLREFPISILTATQVDEDFHARFSATGREYRYRILNRRPPPALKVGMVWWVAAKLDAAAMGEAAKVLLGHHDFTTFRSVHCQAKSPMKTLDRLDVVRQEDEIVVHASARSFLHHQVRNMVGTLKWVGEGRWDAGDVADALKAKKRAAGGPTAPSEGLCLMHVNY